MLLGTALLALLAWGLCWIAWPLALIVLPVFIWLLAFFRDPERPIPQDAGALVSPADGVVSDITELEHVDALGEPAVRIGIFLSVFNVHVNRAPCDGKILSIVYKPGKFINAMSHSAASEQNESNTLVLGDVTTGKPMVMVKQIVGLIARRIVCTAKVGDVLSRGQRFGMIKFGSRTELYIAKSLMPVVKVAIGQPVRGALDILAVVQQSGTDAPKVNVSATSQSA